MRNLFIALLSLGYLVLSSGFTQYHHICDEMSANFSGVTYAVFPHSDYPCQICENKTSDLTGGQKEPCEKDCCKNKIEFKKANDVINYQSTLDLSHRLWGEDLCQKILGYLSNLSLVDEEVENPSPHFSTKTSIGGNPFYIFHCVYRI